MRNVRDAKSTLRELGTSWWALTTVGCALEAGLLDGLEEPRTAASIADRRGIPTEIVTRMLDVLAETGLIRREGDAFVAVEDMASTLAGQGRVALESDIRSTLLQGRDFFASARAHRLCRGWAFADPAILEAQGALSGAFADAIVDKLSPQMPGLEERLASPSASFLDVGTGVGRITIEMCRRLPTLRAVGLEPFDAPLTLARANVIASGFAERIELRPQRVEDITDCDAFDLAWVPAPFLPRDVLTSALAALRRAVRPGGWIISGAYSVRDEGLESAVLKLRTVLYGGDPLGPEDLVGILTEAGFAMARQLPGPPTVPSRMVVAQNPGWAQSEQLPKPTA